jgi:hypothetical protein
MLLALFGAAAAAALLIRSYGRMAVA